MKSKIWERIQSFVNDEFLVVQLGVSASVQRDCARAHARCDDKLVSRSSPPCFRPRNDDIF